MKSKLAEVLDTPNMQALMDAFYEATGIPSSIITVDGQILTGSGWQEICLNFHRRHPEAELACVTSDTSVQEELMSGKKYVIYRCPHGLVDAAAPIIIDGEHVANFFTGQFLFEKPGVEQIHFYRNQAGKYDFNESAYLDALDKVPIIQEQRIESVLNYLTKFAELIGQMSLNHKKEMEATVALRESEQRFRQLSENIREVFWLLDWEAQKVIYVSPAYEEIWGRSATDLYERYEEWADSVHPDDLEYAKRSFEKIAVTGGGESREYRIVRADGAIRWVSDRGFAVRDDSGRVIRIAGVAEDITERKQVEESLRQSEEKYRHLVDDLPEVVFEIDASGRVTFANRVAFELFGYTEDDLEEGLNALDMLAAEDRDRAAENIRRALDGEQVGGIEYTARRKDGSLFPVVARSTRVCHETMPVGLRGVLVDLSDAKRIEQEKLQLEAELRHAQKMEAVGTLAGGIAHEFNNILGIMLGNAELAIDDIPEWNPARFNLNEIKSASFRAKDIVRQLLTFSRKSEENRRPIDIVPVIKEAIKFLRSSIPSSIEFRQNIAAPCHTVEADPTQIHQVIMNLCTNAAHAMEEKGGILEFTLENITLDEQSPELDSKQEPGEYVMLKVSDTGIGVPSEILDRIFDPYFTTKGVGKGTGMGLAVVHGIVENHGGSIRVESQVNKGTKFKVFLPAVQGSAPLDIESRKDFQGGTERILFVDDEESIARLGRLQLERLGYRVEMETSPIEALKIFAANPKQFDLVISDMTMPGMSGDIFLNNILQIRSDIPTIICTGFSERMDEERAREIGARAYVLKPLDRKELAGIVRKVLDKKA